MILLLPTKSDVDEAIQWKIWILSTKLENLDVHPEDESLLGLPGRKLDGLDNIESSVVIIGGGNGYVARQCALFVATRRLTIDTQCHCSCSAAQGPRRRVRSARAQCSAWR